MSNPKILRLGGSFAPPINLPAAVAALEDVTPAADRLLGFDGGAAAKAYTAAEARTLLGVGTGDTVSFGQVVARDPNTSVYTTVTGRYVFLADDADSDGPNFLQLKTAGTLTNSRALSIDLQDGNRTLVVSGDATISGVNTGDQDLSPIVAAARRQTALTDPVPVAGTHVLIGYVQYPFRITALNDLKVASGSLTLTVRINGTAVTGMTSLAVTTTPQDVTLTAPNGAAAAGAVVDVVYSAVAAARGLSGTFTSDRT